MNRKLFQPVSLSVAFILILACSLPGISITIDATQTPTAAIPTDTAPPPPAAELGLAENPLILALPPSANTPEQISAASFIASQLTARTGYVVVTVIPDSEASLVDALGKGNAHIALLSPYAYILAYQEELVKASFAILRNGKSTYGAQFIASRKSGFKPYFDRLLEKNTDSAGAALAQFADKKPCWTDETSASGYIIPLGYLKQNQIITKPPAFVQGHPTVVRSLYVGGICDFGATYIDARTFPSLEDEFPDLMEQVLVIWRIPEIIPYEVLAFSTAMPQAMRDLMAGNISAILQTDEGKAAFKTVYNIEQIQPVNDGDYNDFRTYVEEAGVDPSTLIK